MARSGIVHVHSTLSYDGKHTLAELASFGRKRGYSFIGMTEHSDTFDDAKMKTLVEECRRMSDGGLLLMAGIEFSCESDLHLMGLGITEFTSVRDPIVVARFIRAQGGLAIVSHPSRYGYEIPRQLVGEIDGIEVWNASSDSRFIPDGQVIELWRRLRLQNSTLAALGGQDLHRITRQRHVKLILDGQDGELTAECILAALKGGKFTVSNQYVRINGGQPPGRTRQRAMAWMWRALVFAKSVRDRVPRRAVSG